VLPKGFRRARNFDFLHPNSKRLIALLQVLLKFTPPSLPATIRRRAPVLCACCGAVMTILRTGLPPALLPRHAASGARHRQCTERVSIAFPGHRPGFGARKPRQWLATNRVIFERSAPKMGAQRRNDALQTACLGWRTPDTALRQDNRQIDIFCGASPEAARPGSSNKRFRSWLRTI
jgi:hypothetical protein